MAWRTRVLKVALAALTASAAAMVVPASAQTDPGVQSVPAGLAVTEERELTDGVVHTRLTRDGGAPLVVHVARVQAGGPARLQAVLSAGNVNGGLERTSEMCRRAGCVVAVNADFHHVDSGQPVGGLVSGGVMLRSPVASHHQLTFTPEGAVAAGQLEWSGRLMASDLRDLAFTDVNRPRGDGAIVLYTEAFGPSTATNAYGSELVLRVIEPAGAIQLGQTSLVEVVDFRDSAGDTAIPVGGIVLSGHGGGADRLRDLWARVSDGTAGRRALLRMESNTSASDSVGGSPVLVRDGRVWVADDGPAFVAGRHPRTIVGWTAAGDVLLVTVDGRQPGHSVGMSLADAARLMVGLGAVEALNLDGGGSTTFVTNGAVANQPSDRLVRRGGVESITHLLGAHDELVGWVERPVAVALAVIPSRATASSAVDPLAAGAALPAREAPRELALGLPGGDPGSDPEGAYPALVRISPAPASSDHRRMATQATAAVLLVAVAGTTARTARRRVVT